MYRASWTWTLQAPHDRLWRWISDTNWVNRHAGLPNLTYRYDPREGGGSAAFATYRLGPLRATWEERPTQWLAPEYFAVERLYNGGPLARFANRTTLEAIDAATTRVTVLVELTARSAIFAPLLPLVAKNGKRGADRAFALAERLAATGDVSLATSAVVALPRLRERGCDEEVVSALESFLERADDAELARMQPYALADRLKLDRKATLRAFLLGTQAGYFNLKWDVLCPSCRGPKNSFETLSRMDGALHCDGCNLPYSPVFDRSVEVTFNAAPLGRNPQVAVYCIASPQQSPHVIAQFAVAARSAATVEVTLERGVYDLNAVGHMLVPFTAGDAAGTALSCTLLQRVFEVPHECASGAVSLAVHNETDGEAVVRLEEGRWPDTIVTAAAIAALTEFRDSFSSEVLAPGLELSVESLAILFTDIVGSTSMYSRAGDAPSFRIVTDHFAILREIVARHDGAIVKTIGDAIMAVFNDPARCFEAALEMDPAVRALRVGGAPLRLRVGFHVGPAIAMRANERIDYFGQTVNLAARLEASADAGEIAFSAGVAARPAIAARLQAGGIAVARSTIAVKGFERLVDVLKATVSQQ